jgi:hypothetical protein
VTININSDVGGNVSGNSVNGAVEVNLNNGASVAGVIDGNSGTSASSTLTFSMSTPNGVEFANALATLIPGNGGSGTVTVNGEVYTWTDFDTLVNLIVLLVTDSDDDVVINVIPNSDPASPTICDTGSVKVFHLPNGDLEVYSGFDLLPNGFQVAAIPLVAQTNGATFSSPNAPIQGWTATLDLIDNVQHIVVRDAAGNIINQDC